MQDGAWRSATISHDSVKSPGFAKSTRFCLPSLRPSLGESYPNGVVWKTASGGASSVARGHGGDSEPARRRLGFAGHGTAACLPSGRSRRGRCAGGGYYARGSGRRTLMRLLGGNIRPSLSDAHVVGLCGQSRVSHGSRRGEAAGAPQRPAILACTRLWPRRIPPPARARPTSPALERWPAAVRRLQARRG